MTHTVIIPKPVQKQLDNLPTDLCDRLLEKILQLTEDPRPSGTKKLKGFDNEYRIRIGDYRVCYEIDDEATIVTIPSCKHRKDVYRN
jgi:mRNA interferase RelE/StbE